MQLNCVTYDSKPYYIIFLPNGEKIGLREAEALTMKMLLDQCIEDKSTNKDKKAVAFVQWLKERMRTYDVNMIHASSMAEMNRFTNSFIYPSYSFSFNILYKIGFIFHVSKSLLSTKNGQG